MFGKLVLDRPHQGDIFQRLQYKFITEDGDTETITFPFWIIVSQECDLEHDFKAHNNEYKDQDKYLQTIIACPAFLQLQLKDGMHMQNLSLAMERWGGDTWKKMTSNRERRFHAIRSDEIKELPDLMVDFKRIFSFSREYIYKQLNNRVATLDVLYREEFSQRLANFTSRIALPDELSQ